MSSSSLCYRSRLYVAIAVCILARLEVHVFFYSRRIISSVSALPLLSYVYCLAGTVFRLFIMVSGFLVSSGILSGHDCSVCILAITLTGSVVAYRKGRSLLCRLSFMFLY